MHCLLLPSSTTHQGSLQLFLNSIHNGCRFLEHHNLLRDSDSFHMLVPSMPITFTWINFFLPSSLSLISVSLESPLTILLKFRSLLPNPIVPKDRKLFFSFFEASTLPFLFVIIQGPLWEIETIYVYFNRKNFI